jgi:HSP20 family protein
MLPLYRNRGAAFGTLVDLSREVDRLMNTIAPDAARDGGSWFMPAEVVETDDEIRFAIEMPGLRPDDIEVTVHNNVLTVTADKRPDEERSEREVRLFERRYGRMQRSFTVPSTVSGDRCEAGYEHGVLTLRLPKAEESKPRRIAINGTGNGRSIEQSA